MAALCSHDFFAAIRNCKYNSNETLGRGGNRYSGSRQAGKI